MPETPTTADSVLKYVQAGAIVISLVVSVPSYFLTRLKEAQAREIEARVPFLQLRQKRYVEIGEVVATLLSEDATHSSDDAKVQHARKRFRELYIVELSMVESPEVAKQMVKLAEKLDPTLLKLNESERRAYDLAIALQNSFSGDLGLELVTSKPKENPGGQQ